MGYAPRRPFRLTARAKENANSRLRGGNPCITTTAVAAGVSRRHSSSTSIDKQNSKKHPHSSSSKGFHGGDDTGTADVSRESGDGSGANDGGDGGGGMWQKNQRGGGLGVGEDLEAAEEAAVAAAAVAGGGDDDGGRGGNGKPERKKLPCGMCGAMRTPEDVSFRMTTKMVREALFHVSEESHTWVGAIRLGVNRLTGRIC